MYWRIYDFSMFRTTVAKNISLNSILTDWCHTFCCTLITVIKV